VSSSRRIADQRGRSLGLVPRVIKLFDLTGRPALYRDLPT